MGCGGCELFPSPRKVLAAIDEAVAGTGVTINSKRIFKELVDDAFDDIENPLPGHRKAVTTTNIWHLRKLFIERIHQNHEAKAAEAADLAITRAITCYAAVQHLNKGASILKPGYHPKKGYAPVFEAVKTFEGRMKDTAKLPDLLGMLNPDTPWKYRMARMIFVSDMGDALSAQRDFPFLKREVVPAFLSEQGKRHLWLWLTKRPGTMAKFADAIGGFPENVCAMTTLTGADDESLQRLADLKRVKASIRGLSIEPLWERIPPSQLNLKGIDWVIVGGESGSGKNTRHFALEWAEELREHCKKHGVAFFLKQLGRNPSRNGEVFKLKDSHGGNWDEWDEALKIREFPKAFHDYRKNEMSLSSDPRPIQKPKRKKPAVDPTVTPEEKADYKRLHKIVEKGLKAFWEVGEALADIKAAKLWKAGGYETWEAYCRSVAGMSRIHAYRMMQAHGVVEILKTLPRGNILPQMEAQVRPLLKLPDPEKQVEAWTIAVERSNGQQPSAPEVSEVVFEILHPEGAGDKVSPTRGQRRTDLVSRLREVIRKRKSWEQVEELLEELEGLL